MSTTFGNARRSGSAAVLIGISSSSTIAGGGGANIQFDDIFESGSEVIPIGLTYLESGFRLNASGPIGNGFAAYQSGHPNWICCSAAIFLNEQSGSVELVKDDGGAFRLIAIDFASLLGPNFPGITFVGERNGVVVATQSFSGPPVFGAFFPEFFSEDFENVDRVTWNIPEPAFALHCDNFQITGPVETILESAELGPTGQTTGLILSTQYVGHRFSLSETSTMIEIGSHLFREDPGTFWGAIIPLPGVPTPCPPQTSTSKPTRWRT